MNSIGEPIHTPEGIAQPESWVQEENDALLKAREETIGYLKSRKELLRKGKANYKDIHRDVNSLPYVTDHDFKRAVLDDLVAEGEITQDQELYWYERHEPFDVFMSREIEKFASEGIAVEYNRINKRLSITMDGVSSSVISNSIIKEGVKSLFAPSTIDILFHRRHSAGILYQNNFSVYSERELVETSTGIYFGKTSFEEYLSQFSPSKTFINLSCSYQGAKAREDIEGMLRVVRNSLTSKKVRNYKPLVEKIKQGLLVK